MSEERTKIPLFDGKNYNDWRFRMEVHLDKDDMLDFVNKGFAELTKQFEVVPADNANVKKRKEESIVELTRKDKRCKNSIIERLGDEVLEVVKGKTHAYDVWRVLSDRFSKTQVSSRILKSKQFHQIKYRPKEETFLEYCVKFDKLARELKLCGSNMDDITITLQFLWSLPKEFEAVVNSLQALDYSQLTLDMVRLRVEEFDLIRSDKKTAGNSSNDSFKGTNVAFSARGGARRTYLPNIDCNNCGKTGHKRADCWLEGGGAYNSRASRGRGRGDRTQGCRGGQNNNFHQNGRGRGGRGWSQGGSGRGGYNSFRGGNNNVRGEYRGRGYGHQQKTNQHQNHANSANTSDSPPKKTKFENASLAGADESREAIVYSFMSSEVNETIKVKTPIHTETLLFGQVQEGSAVMFILDSGASRHLVKTDVPVQSKKRLSEPVLIQVAKSDIQLKAYFKGRLECESGVNGQTKMLQVEVLIVEDLAHNLISISSLEKQGYEITFWNGKCYIKFEKELVALGSRECNLYIMWLNIIWSDVSMLTGDAEKVNVWHRRLGHIGAQRLTQLSKMVDGIGELKCEGNTLCDVCIQGKQAKLPFGGSRVRATRPLERIHSDVCGPIAPTALGGVRFILTFIDDYTHFAVVYGLVKKSEVYQYFREYEARVTNRFPRKICNFRCDNGTEFVNHAMRDLCAEKGITFELTIPGTPENNGVAERLNRSLLEKARCLLLGSSLSKRFWHEAILTATYLLNRCPTRAVEDNKVPAELWYKSSQDLSRLRVFGCIVFVKKPKEQLEGKFDSRSKPCIMLGYCDNGYRVWSIDEQKIIVARNVIFDETRSKFNLDDNLYDVPEFVEGDDSGEDSTEVNFNEQEHVVEDKGNNEGANIPDAGIPHIEEFDEEDSGTGRRRSSRIKLKPLYLQDYASIAEISKFVDAVTLKPGTSTLDFNLDNKIELACSVSELNDVPTCFQDLASRPDKQKWMEAVNEELQALVENETWFLVPMPDHKKPINCMWVFALKFDENGNLNRFKARLVVKGCAQKPGIDFNETYAPVAKLVTLRVFLCLVNKERMFMYQLDVKNAFLNGNLTEEIYMYPPEGLPVPNNTVCKLNKSLYGLKQAPLEWNRKFDEAIKLMGFTQCLADKCLYVKKDQHGLVYLLLYVDDILIASCNQEILLQVQSQLMSKFKMRDLGEASHFLGIKITRNENGMFLSQESYLQKVLQKFAMDLCAPVKTPLERKPSYDITSTPTVIGEKPYRELIGSLMYACMASRPDICTSVNFFSQFQENATVIQWKGLKRVLRYIQSCKNWGLWFKANSCSPLTLYVDADFANEPGRRSISGFVIEMFGDPVLWCTRKQTCVALSSTEAEFIALATATSELLWLRQLLCELSIDTKESIPVFEDNQSCIHALNNWNVKRLKHIDIKYNFIKDLHQKKIISVQYIPTGEQKADVLTKGLSYDVFKYHRQNLGMCELTSSK